MSVTFDGQNKIIQVNPGVTAIDIRYDVYSRWKEWVMQGDNAKWLPAFRVSGGDPIGGGKISPIYFFLINGWTIRPDDTSGNHELLVELNLYSDPDIAPRFTSVPGVTIANLNSDVPGVTAEAISDAVWNAQLSIYKQNGSFGSFVQKLLTVAKFIGLK